MLVGLVKEIKNHEYRVGLTPRCVQAYVANGHEVIVEQGAGMGVGFSDEQYITAGASIYADKAALFHKADMLVKVKEFIEPEYALLKPESIVFTYLHLAAEPELTKVLLDKKISAIAYETIMLADNSLPCLAPMSAIAGRLAVQEGAKYLEKPYGGRGVLLGGIPGIARGTVVIIGGGVVGLNACKMAVGIGANVIVLDTNIERLNYLDDIFSGQITTLYSNRANLEDALQQADLLIGAVLIMGASAPNLVKRADLQLMKIGAVIVDVAIDQGGCIETSHVTSHEQPTYIVDGIVHYAVGNMPGAVALSSTFALTNATLQYGLTLANHSLEQALAIAPALVSGLNTYQGNITLPAAAESLGYNYVAYGT
jgi:alanine dehydrogenase